MVGPLRVCIVLTFFLIGAMYPIDVLGVLQAMGSKIWETHVNDKLVYTLGTLCWGGSFFDDLLTSHFLCGDGNSHPHGVRVVGLRGELG